MHSVAPMAGLLLLALTAYATPVADAPPPATPVDAPYLRVVEVAIAPPEKAQQVVSVRMTPGVTRTYDRLRFECVYRQEYDWTDSAGRRQRRVNEPVRFAYDRDTVRLTDDLDHHVSFRMPIGVDLLRSRFGADAFRPDVPISVPRLSIEALAGGVTVWRYEVPVATGPQTLTAAHRADLVKGSERTTPKPRHQRAALGTVNLD